MVWENRKYRVTGWAAYGSAFISWLLTGAATDRLVLLYRFEKGRGFQSVHPKDRPVMA
jgi:hypothetical protein